MQFMAEMMFTKMQEKNRYCLYHMNANTDACIKEGRKRALPGLEVVMMVALVDLLCLIFLFIITIIISVDC